ncbi:sulfite exporter TauE/SafE family protein [Pseudomonas sp. S75]|uniref:sulfite exporter TauE/SafE family protein n=1 Tax=unclassified Pseudomonas TaxID=196821 RepID=UPI0019056660|nr:MULTISPECIES: sulfite exporter TauE/SafE family protein [unclassified Pseudomonas]MBJ9977622.1 sulfite exporter TauE/SafE family protein [Pseudomonas sp. S30]MBK0154994.1 sulfite exporter TauE/SafE family protein [Pseudomonas sp. S75]
MNETFFFYSMITLTFIAAGLVKGVTGMGLPTVAMGLLGTAMPPSAAAAILIIPSFVTNVWQFVSGPAIVRLIRRLWPMQLAIVIGTVLGSALLISVNPLWSGFALGTALIIYAAYALFAPPLVVTPGAEKWLSPIIGLITGAVTGATGVFVMPAVPYLQSLQLEKEELVQALGLSFTVSTLALAAGLLLHGGLKVDQLGLSTLAIIPALVGMFIGQTIRARISAKRFKQCFLAFLIVLGMELASRPFF